jgi:hypothetical protein
MKTNTTPGERALSEQMRRASLALTPEKRRANGRKAWATRKANLEAKLAVEGVKE